MDDLDDIFEAAIDVEDVVEEVFEPEDLLEDVLEDPLEVLLALVAAAAALFTLVVLAVLLLALALRYGFVAIVGGVALLGLLATALAVAGFLYVRRDVPRRVERRIERARERAGESRTADATAEDGTGTADGGAERTDAEALSEEEAIERLREQYAEREITVRELEERLEAVMQSDDPERVVREYERQ